MTNKPKKEERERKLEAAKLLAVQRVFKEGENNKTTDALIVLLGPENIKDIIFEYFKGAVAGTDAEATNFIMDRLFPKVSHSYVSIDLPSSFEDEDILRKEILIKLLERKISIEETTTLFDILLKSKNLKMTALNEKLSHLEALLPKLQIIDGDSTSSEFPTD